MSSNLPSISKALLAGLVCFGMAGCQSPEPKTSDRPVAQERVFYASFEDVERALKQAMIKYPPRIDNSDTGVFETDYVKGDARFRPPHKEVSFSNGYRYRILLRLVRGTSEDKPAVKAVIVKQPEIARDFFSDPEPLGTDGLEEMTILYRMQRELAIDRAIRRAQEKSNRQTPAH